MLKSLASFGPAASLGFVGSCGGNTPADDAAGRNDDDPGPARAGTARDGFNHDGTLTLDIDPFQDGLNVSKEESERTHSCGKISFRTMARSSRGAV